ncbi:MAG: HAMP domain-containing sensor histidine kinase [Actinomycetota bacterium]|nr:HAMP domain-containing sensor histidine kinase [Actinomycetota bacterium]
MTRRLLAGYLTITVVVLLLLELPLAIFFSQRELERFTAGVEHDASVIASIYEDDLQTGATLDPQAALLYTERTDARVVIVDANGISLIDTERPVPRDLSTRPEIADAIADKRSSGTRSSSTLGTDFVFVAIPVSSGGVVHGALRVTIDTDRVDASVHRFWLGLVVVGAGVLALMAVVGWMIARSVTRPLRQLERNAARFSEGDLAVHDTVREGPLELRSLSATMSTMAERLAALLDEQREFVADASHQLRTPLTALRLRLENLQARLPDAEGDELESAIEETTRLATLVGDLLQLARADQGQPPVTIDLAQVAIQRVDTWSALAEAAGVTLQVEGADAPLWASAAPGAMEQILDNTLDNALNVSPEGSLIVVRLRADGDRRTVVIEDHGPGLSDDDKERATRRFWRKTATTPGTGLGLAIASSLARASSGSLTLTDSPGGGLSVVVTLPGSQ